MPIPPYINIDQRCSISCTKDAKKAYDHSVGAGDGAGSARISRADTDDGDGRAGQANRNVEVLDDDTQKADEGRSSGVASLLGNYIYQ